MHLLPQGRRREDIVLTVDADDGDAVAAIENDRLSAQRQPSAHLSIRIRGFIPDGVTAETRFGATLSHADATDIADRDRLGSRAAGALAP
jgi:hypothetical protein